MAITNEQYQQLMRFMDCDMTQDEINDFEKELEGNADLKLQLDFEQEIRDAVSSNVFAPKENTIKPNYRYLKLAAAAASIILLCIIAFLVTSKEDKKEIVVKQKDTIYPINRDTANHVIAQTKKAEVNTDSLFAVNYKKEPSPKTYPLLLAEAFENYNNNNYTFIDKFDTKNIPQLRGGDDDVQTTLLLLHFYKGMVALERGSATYAIKNFTQSITYSKDESWKDKIYWYLALSYLKARELEKAKNTLTLIQSNKYNNLKIEKLLKQINY